VNDVFLEQLNGALSATAGYAELAPPANATFTYVGAMTTASIDDAWSDFDGGPAVAETTPFAWERFENKPRTGLLGRLDELGKLIRDWDGYGAEAPNSLAVANAELVICELCRVEHEPDRVVASAEGGIGVYLFRLKKRMLVECFNDGDICALISGSDFEPQAWALDQDDGLRESLSEILGTLDA
jgi:hypothetical protein